MSIIIDDVELKGESYLTIDKSGCWIWENIEPVLNKESKQYELSRSDREDGLKIDYNTIGTQAVKNMLNLANLDFNFGYAIINGDTPRKFKVTVSEVVEEKRMS